jgi:hypothetical protein
LGECRVKRLMLATRRNTVEFETNVIGLPGRPALERAVETQTNFLLMYEMYMTFEPTTLFAVTLPNEDSITCKMSLILC